MTREVQSASSINGSNCAADQSEVVSVLRLRSSEVAGIVSNDIVVLLGRERKKSGPAECNFVEQEPRTAQAVPKLGRKVRHLSHFTTTIDLTCTALVRGYMEGEIEH